MKYSLRSLMISLTLFCVLLGGRIEYLRRWADYHEREARRCALEMEKERESGPFRNNLLLIAQWQAHEAFAQDYRFAVLRPWTIVTRPPSPRNDNEIVGGRRDE
jgi:hypothetical protein